MRLSDMQKKDIIYLNDGKNLGHIIDAEIELNTGNLKSLLIEKKTLRSLFTSEPDVVIKDVILVDTTR